MARKNLVLDTNVLLHDPRAIYNFQDNHVIIPIYVIEEIDGFKKELSERGRNAREVARNLDSFREKGRLSDGVPIGEPGHEPCRRTGVAIEGGKEPPAAIEHERLIVEPGGNRARGRLPADPPALGGLAAVNERASRDSPGLSSRVGRRFSGRGHAAGEREQPGPRGDHRFHARPVSRRVAISGLA